MKVALILENKIAEIKDIDDASYSMAVMKYQAGIDISAMSPLPEVGWEYRNGQLIAPVSADNSKKITKLALRNRLTMTEKVTLEGVAAQNNTTGYTLRSWIADFNVSTYIDLSRPDTIAGFQFLEAAGLLGAGRASEILNNPITEIERYHG